MLTVGWLTLLPPTMVNPLDVTVGRSLVVATCTVLPVPAPPFVTPRNVIWSWSPGLTKPLLKNPHVLTRPLPGFVHVPTSTLRVTSRTVPLCHSGAVVPLGSVSVISLPASPDSPPVAETAKAIT